MRRVTRRRGPRKGSTQQKPARVDGRYAKWTALGAMMAGLAAVAKAIVEALTGPR